MDIGPIWRAMLRNKAGFVLIALQIAVTLTIVVNAFGIIQERAARIARTAASMKRIHSHSPACCSASMTAKSAKC